MLTVDIALAVLLITTPDAEFDVRPPSTVFQAVGVALEIIDKAECGWLFNGEEGFDYHLQVCRDRWQEIADAPPAYDASRFPCREMCLEALTFNSRYRAHLDDMRQLWPGMTWEIDEALSEANGLYGVWDAAADVQAPFYGVYYKRLRLKQLRDAIGCDAYYNGAMPPFVPIWRFNQIGE
jgi:hypothetical protein